MSTSSTSIDKRVISQSVQDIDDIGGVNFHSWIYILKALYSATQSTEEIKNFAATCRSSLSLVQSNFCRSELVDVRDPDSKTNLVFKNNPELDYTKTCESLKRTLDLIGFAASSIDFRDFGSRVDVEAILEFALNQVARCCPAIKEIYTPVMPAATNVEALLLKHKVTGVGLDLLMVDVRRAVRTSLSIFDFGNGSKVCGPARADIEQFRDAVKRTNFGLCRRCNERYSFHCCQPASDGSLCDTPTLCDDCFIENVSAASLNPEDTAKKCDAELCHYRPLCLIHARRHERLYDCAMDGECQSRGKRYHQRCGCAGACDGCHQQVCQACADHGMYNATPCARHFACLNCFRPGTDSHCFCTEPGGWYNNSSQLLHQQATTTGAS